MWATYPLGHFFELFDLRTSVLLDFATAQFLSFRLDQLLSFQTSQCVNFSISQHLNQLHNELFNIYKPLHNNQYVGNYITN